MHKMSHASMGPPSAWRGLQSPTSSRKTLGDSIAKEFQAHPLETLGLLAAAIAMARLAFSRSRREPPKIADIKLAARRRSGH